VIFSTITNAHEGLTCLHISKGVTQAVGGFKDSSVRVWKLNEREREGESGFGRLIGGSWSMSDVLPNGPIGSKDAKASGGSRESSGVGDMVKQPRDVLELYGHSKAVYGVSQSCEEGNRLVLSSSADETIRLWDTSVSQCVAKYSCLSPSWGVSFSPLGCYFASANQVRFRIRVRVRVRIFKTLYLTDHFSILISL
jgi:WD40 repeat protein